MNSHNLQFVINVHLPVSLRIYCINTELSKIHPSIYYHLLDPWLESSGDKAAHHKAYI